MNGWHKSSLEPMRERIIDLIRQGKTGVKIAAEIGETPTKVCRFINRYNLAVHCPGGEVLLRSVGRPSLHCVRPARLVRKTAAALPNMTEAFDREVKAYRRKLWDCGIRGSEHEAAVEKFISSLSQDARSHA